MERSGGISLPTSLLALVITFFSSSLLATEINEPPVVFPSHWQTSMFHESVFDSQLFVVEVGRRSRPTVLLVHGLGQAGLTDWLEVIPALEQQFHVIALDLPGFGRSDTPRGIYSPTNYAHLLHQVKQQFSPGPVHVVGHSMGGAVALRYSSMYPQDINSVVLVDAAGILARTAFVKHSTGALIGGQQLPAILDGAKSAAIDYAGVLLEKLGQLPDPTTTLGNYPALWSKVFGMRTNANAGLALVKEDFTDAVYSNPHRVNIIWGSDDSVAPLRTGKLMAGQMQNASLAVIENAGHVPMISMPQEFNRLLLYSLPEGRHVNDAVGGSPERQSPGQSSAQAIVCNGQSNQNYSGTYEEVLIQHCSSTRLTDVITKRLIIRDSSVELENVRVVSTAIAAVIERSAVVATNTDFSGPIGMLVSDSRLDFAGAAFEADITGIETVYPSDFIFSISKMHSPHYEGYLHGQFSVPLGNLEAQVR